MSRRSVSARIAPGIELTQIRVYLAPFGTPTIELEGTVRVRDRKAALASTAVVRTLHLTPEGERFIEAMKAAFIQEPDDG